MHSPRWVAIMGLAAGVAVLTGCGASSERIVYEVTSSGVGAKLTYATTEGIEPLHIEEDMSETSWTLAPDLILSSTTPMLSVTPPPGGAVRCRILLLDDEGVAVVADEIGLINGDVECVYDGK